MRTPTLTELPHSLEAERAVLGSMLVDPASIVKVFSLIRPEEFYQSVHKKIAIAIEQVYEDSGTCTMVLVSDQLKNTGELEQVGGSLFLTELMDTITSSAHASNHAKVIHDKYLRRLFIEKATSAIQRVESGEEIASVLSTLEESVYTKSKLDDEGTIEDAVHEWLAHIDAVKTGDFGIVTGLPPIDQMIGGLRGGDYCIVAGRPSTGKTAFGFQMLAHSALTDKRLGGVFSLEMPRKWIPARIASQISGVNLFDFAHGQLDGPDYEKVDDELDKLVKLDFPIHDNPATSIWELKNVARRWKVERGIEFILIDYLQLIEGKGDSRNQEVTYISKRLKQLARELDIPVVCISQLSRASEMGVATPRKPRLSDLRDSGAIEQDADLVMFVHRYPAESSDVTFIIAKQRNGPVGEKSLVFDNTCARFREWDSTLDRRAEPYET